MTLSELKDILEASILVGNEHLNREFDKCGASDLMSDILADMSERCVILTGLTTVQAVRECSVRAVTGTVSGSHFMVDIPKASVRASANLQFRKLSTENGTVGFICRILQGRTPGGTRVPPIRITKL